MPKNIQDKNILITLGATREPIDAVRFISNYSSGKQGNEIAKVLANKNANIYIVAGFVQVHLENKDNIQIFKVDTAENMYKKTKELINKINFDLAICTAAVSDWKIDKISKSKIKKDKNIDSLSLNFTKTKDILYHLANDENRPKFVVGFAAESDNIEEYAKKKLIDKNCDVIVANNIYQDKQLVMGSDNNKVTLFFKNGENYNIETAKKDVIAIKIIDILLNKGDF